MSESLYELVALGARYVFAALMVLIVLRAWRITIVDSRRADMRIRHASIMRKHAYFQLTDRGLIIQARPGAAMRDADGRRVDTLLLGDGSEFTLGRVRLLLVLSDGRMTDKSDDEATDFPDENEDLFLEEMEI